MLCELRQYRIEARLALGGPEAADHHRGSPGATDLPPDTKASQEPTTISTPPRRPHPNDVEARLAPGLRGLRALAARLARHVTGGVAVPTVDEPLDVLYWGGDAGRAVSDCERGRPES